MVRSAFLCSGGMLLAGFLLGVGYYFGYLHASSLFMEHMRAEALNDRITAALYIRYGDASAQSHQAEEESQLSPSDGNADSSEGSSAHTKEQMQDAELVVPPSREIDQESQSQNMQSVPSDGVQLFEAHLIGFGSLKSAESYVARLKKLDIGAQVRHHMHLVRKKRIVWYQVVSDPAPYHEALRIVEMLKKIDRLSGVVLVESAPHEPLENIEHKQITHDMKEKEIVYGN